MRTLSISHFTVVLYAISAVYFAGVMVRLMLTLTPVVCVLASIAFSKTFDIYLKDDAIKPKPVEEEKEKNDKYYDKVSVSKHSAVFFVVYYVLITVVC